MVTTIFHLLSLWYWLLCRLHIVVTSRKTHWARKHLDYKNQVYKTLTLRAFLKTKKKNNFRWTNFINRKLILKKNLWIKKMKALQDSEVCWPTLHINAQGSLTNWREKTPSRPENSSGIFRNGRLIRGRKITAVYCCCECSTRIQYPRRTTVNVVLQKLGRDLL